MRRITLLLLGMYWLVSCTSDKGTDSNGGSPTDTTWRATDSLLLNTYNTLPRILHVDYPHLYVVGDGGFLAVVDISSPDSLAVIGIHASEGISSKSPTYLSKQGSYLFVCLFTKHEHPDTLEVFDVSTSSAPQSAGLIASGKMPLSSGYYHFDWAMAGGDTLLVSSHGVWHYDIGSLPTISQVGDAHLFDSIQCTPSGISPVGTDAAHFYFVGQCTDSTTPAYLWAQRRGTLSPVSMTPIQASISTLTRHELVGNRVFLTGYNPNAVAILDVTNPTSPVVLQSTTVFTNLTDATNSPFVLWKIIPADTLFVLTGWPLDDWMLRSDGSFANYMLAPQNGSFFVNDVAYYDGRIFAATSLGVYVFPAR